MQVRSYIMLISSIAFTGWWGDPVRRGCWQARDRRAGGNLNCGCYGVLRRCTCSRSAAGREFSALPFMTRFLLLNDMMDDLMTVTKYLDD
jgi:hypothetical protein